MQYYYVSSPYGYRIHPKTKLKQMHYGIDMAGTWQEEVRAPADGLVVSAGETALLENQLKYYTSTVFQQFMVTYTN